MMQRPELSIARKKPSGFTLIELVIVIILIGILAAVAIPKYIDLTTEARTAAVKEQAANLSAAAALNFASVKVKGTGSLPTNCTDVGTMLVGGLDTTKYTITPGTTSPCTVTSNTGSISATFQVIEFGS